MSTTPPSAQQWREAMQHFESWLAADEPERSDGLAILAKQRPDLHVLVIGLIDADRDASSLGFLSEGGLAAVSAPRCWRRLKRKRGGAIAG